jgi:hypothetical protein
LIERFEVKSKVLVKNFQNLIDTEEKTIMSKSSLLIDFGWNKYCHLKSIFSWMDHLIAKFDFVSPLELGRTFEGNPIKGLTISKRSGNFAIVIEGGIHAREWIATSVATFIIHQLIHSNGWCSYLIRKIRKPEKT